MVIFCGSGGRSSVHVSDNTASSVRLGNCKIYLFIFNIVVVMLRTQSLIN